MEQRIKDFVEAYNKRCVWNQDILAKFDKGFIPKKTKDTINGYLSTKEITEEGYDLEHAKMFEFERDSDGEEVHELQAFNNENYGASYFWVLPNETEEEYKKRTSENLLKETLKNIRELSEKINELTVEKDEYDEIKKYILDYKCSQE